MVVLRVGFIIGSPRSGTTILGNIFDCHPEIAQWYEPYYLWERYFPAQDSDVWSADRLDDGVEENIRREFALFSRWSDRPLVLDKSPGHSFNIAIIDRIFPDAKWIHIIRDGRDVTLSIQKEWEKRAHIVMRRSFTKLFAVAFSMLRRQPFWRYRLMAISYELRAGGSLNLFKFLNKSKWEGQVGWGPRFKGWKEYLETHSPLEFNAMQWVKSVEAVQESWPFLPESNKIEIRYEDLLKFPEETLTKVLDVLGVKPSRDFFVKIPKLKKNNFHKWEREFTKEEIAAIKPILAPMIDKLGYGHPSQW